MKKRSSILCKINLALFLSSFFLFIVTWFQTSDSLKITDHDRTVLTKDHKTAMAGSLAQISEKVETETDSELEKDAETLATLLPFIKSLYVEFESGPSFGINFNFQKISGESIFLLIRNFRI